jgi:hypothetical protein
MTIYIFHCRKDPEWFALTKDPGGKGLPHNAISVTVREAAVHDERIARAIETDGYHLFRVSSGP